MSRVYNFSAGPAVLPEEVLKEVADEMMDYNGTGMSVMEMSHRSAAFQEIIDTAEKDLRELMNIPDNYKVLFLQGGASQQFAMIPMNLMKNKVADYIVTGQWAKKLIRKLRNTEKQTRSHLLKIKPSAISRTAVICRSARMQTMYTFAKTRQSTELPSRSCRTQRARFWFPTSHQCSCQSLATWKTTASSGQAFRRT